MSAISVEATCLLSMVDSKCPASLEKSRPESPSRIMKKSSGVAFKIICCQSVTITLENMKLIWENLIMVTPWRVACQRLWGCQVHLMDRGGSWQDWLHVGCDLGAEGGGCLPFLTKKTTGHSRPKPSHWSPHSDLHSHPLLPRLLDRSSAHSLLRKQGLPICVLSGNLSVLSLVKLAKRARFGRSWGVGIRSLGPITRSPWRES